MARTRKGSGSIFQRKSDGLWVARIEAGTTSRGTRRRIQVTGKSKAEVGRKLRDLKDKISQDGIPETASSISVKKWCEQWIGLRADIVRPGTFVADRGAVNKWIIPTIGHRRLDSLGPRDIRDVMTAMDKAGLALSSMTRTHRVISKLLKDAVAEGYTVPQRARETPGPGSAPVDRDALPVDTALKILSVARARPDVARWAVALMLGIRPAEALGLTWDMVDFEHRTITVAWQLKALPYKVAYDRSSGFRVPRGFETKRLEGSYHLVRPKTKAAWRVIPTTDWVFQQLQEWKQVAPYSPYGLVWPAADGRYQTDTQDRDIWKDICVQADVWVTSPDGTTRRPDLYEARHTAATLLLTAGVDETTIKAILGHSTVLSTKAYLHADQARVKAALNKSAQQLQLEPSAAIP